MLAAGKASGLLGRRRNVSVLTMMFFADPQVYGNTAGAELRLITCDGYDPATGMFEDNYVVYATLVTDR